MCNSENKLAEYANQVKIAGQEVRAAMELLKSNREDLRIAKAIYKRECKKEGK